MKRFRVEVDSPGCTLCEVCAARCPTGALVFSTDGEAATLVFQAALCDGCAGAFPCREHCPEKVLRVTGGDGPPSVAPLVLARGRLARCAECGALFGPGEKLEAVRRRVRATAERDLALRTAPRKFVPTQILGAARLPRGATRLARNAASLVPPLGTPGRAHTPSRTLPTPSAPGHPVTNLQGAILRCPPCRRKRLVGGVVP